MPNQPLIFDTAIAKDKPENIRHPHNACPFSDPGQLTDIIAQDADRIWLLNKFPTLQATWQTIVIEAARHDGDIATYSSAQNRAVFAFALKHWQATIASGRFKSVLCYKNFGPHSGGSLRHPHMQIVGLMAADGYANVTAANLTGYSVLAVDQVQVTVSDRPIMGFVEINVAAPATAIAPLADAVQQVVQYTLNTYFHGQCDSYNLFFYPRDDQIVAKVVPLFNVSPYYIGYRLAQADTPKRMRAIAEEIRQQFERSNLAHSN
ncbi:Galactose-1-phosphate uridylyltransferase [Lactiplantibacillus plantarum]|nr:DUF4931 domain-containing protein [Lactiplantibacillus plantarum]OUT00488.1 Galactose-1-phosphate uridylyltransferase [Lactiplantibacillus plantarum]OUT03774.1 Galactose-1-phosphate uridylyltransferase [Lactiplantibacillus plantarum]